MSPEYKSMFPASPFFRWSCRGERPQFLAPCNTAAELQPLHTEGSRPLKPTQGKTCDTEMQRKLSLAVGGWPYRAPTFPDLAAAASAFFCKRGETHWGSGNEGTCPPAHGLPHCPVSLQPGCSVLVAGEEKGHKTMFFKNKESRVSSAAKVSSSVSGSRQK